MRPDIRPGAPLPDYTLPDHTGTPRSLSSIQSDNPMILVLSRGNFCPKDREQHRMLVALEPEIEVAYTKIVTISTDDQLELNEMRTGAGAHWPFLSDPERTVQKDLDVQEYTDPRHNPMVPYTFVLEPGLVIHSIYNGYWYWGRPGPEDLRRDLREVTKKIRPDWDIGAPGMREAWERGDKKSFFPYGKLKDFFKKSA
jgi:peroxiredoxin